MLILFCSFSVAPTVSAASTRPLKYYVVDRVRSNTDFATLASWGINTAIVDFKTDGTTASWDSMINAAASAGINLVIWPDAHQGSDVAGCRWETPFDDGTTGGGTDYLVKIRALLTYAGNKPNVIGIVTAHEPVWVNATDQDRCSETVTDMTAIKTQIHEYINNTVKRNTSYAPFKVWNYIDNIYNMSNLKDYSTSNKAAQIQGIMDVAVIWQHCAGFPTNSGDGSACEGSGQYTALGGINADRALIQNNGLEGKVETVFISQTFSQGTNTTSSHPDYAGKFTLEELEKYSCDWINTGALDGYGYYTWDEGWYTGNLKKWTDLQPAIAHVRNTCMNVSGATPIPTVPLTSTPVPTKSATPTPTISPTKSPTLTPNPTPIASIACPSTGSVAGGKATMTVTVTQAGNYKMWIQMMGKGDAANALWLQLDNLYCVKVGDLAGMPSNTWEWVDYHGGIQSNKIPMPIVAGGSHTITLYGDASEKGVAVGRMLMTRDTTCIPTGIGDACIGIVSTPTPTISATPKPTPMPTPQTITKPIFQTASLPHAKRGTSYSAKIVATDQTPSDTLSMVATGLPRGLTLGNCVQSGSGFGGATLTCSISGFPARRGIYVPKFTVTDKLGNATTKSLRLSVF